MSLEDFVLRNFFCFNIILKLNLLIYSLIVPGEVHGNPLQYSCVENPHGQRSLVGYSPLGHRESDMTEQLSTGQHFSFRFHSLLLRNITLSVIVFCSCMFKLSLSWLDPSYQVLNTLQSFPLKKKKSLNPTFPLQLSSHHLIISFPLWHTFWTWFVHAV